jgi:hypothetical protein
MDSDSKQSQMAAVVNMVINRGSLKERAISWLAKRL